MPDLTDLIASVRALGAVSVSITPSAGGRDRIDIHASEIPAWLDTPPERVRQFESSLPAFTAATWMIDSAEVCVILRPAQPDLAPASPIESSEGVAGSQAVGAVGGGS